MNIEMPDDELNSNFEDKVEKKPTDADALYAKLKNQAPVREVDDSADEVPRSISEAEDESPNDTDLVATLRRLFPKFPIDLIDRVARVGMMARIAPDVFLDQHNLTVSDIVEELEIRGTQEISVQEVINLVYFAFTIGLDGKGRIDAIELHGSAREEAELAEVTKRLGSI